MPSEQTRPFVRALGVWLLLAFAEIVPGALRVAGYSWRRIAEDYDLQQGGLLGMVVLTISPLLAAKLRAVAP